MGLIFATTYLNFVNNYNKAVLSNGVLAPCNVDNRAKQDNRTSNDWQVISLRLKEHFVSSPCLRDSKTGCCANVSEIAQAAIFHNFGFALGQVCIGSEKSL